MPGLWTVAAGGGRVSDDTKPVLWVSLTESGRATATEDSMAQLGDDIQAAVGDDYNVIVADDTVRLATQEDLQELRSSIDQLLPSDLDTARQQREQERQEMGLSADEVMGGGDTADGETGQHHAESEPEGYDMGPHDSGESFEEAETADE